MARVALAAGIFLAGMGWQTAAAAAPLLALADGDLSIVGELGTFHVAWDLQRPEANCCWRPWS